MSKSMSSQEILNLLRASLFKHEEEVPPGFKTIEEWRKEWGFKPSQTRRLLYAGVASGIIQERYFRIKVGKDLTRKIMHYAPVSKSKG